MATGQVIGRHEVFEYSYRVGPTDDRKRIKLVVIQRREQRRKSLIAAQKHFERVPVRLRVNLHRAQGDPEVTSGSRQVPITLRRKAKPAPITTTRIRHGLPTPPETRTHASDITPLVVHTHTHNSHSSAPEPARIELVDRPVPPTPSDSGILVADPDPVLVIPSASDPGHDSPSPHIVVPSLSRSSSQTSLNRPKVKRSNSFGSSFRRFPSILGMLRRNSKPTTPPPVILTDSHSSGYFEHDAPRTSGSDNMIVEERESELGSPVGPPAGHGPPSVAGSRKPIPSVPESTASGRSRTFSFGSPRNKLVKASPRNVPLPESIRDPSLRDHSVGGSPLVMGAYPYGGSEHGHDGRSVHSRRTDRSVHDRSIRTPEYVHETYLHDSPTAHTHSSREPSVAHHSMCDGSVVTRSVLDGRSHDGRSHDGRSNDGRSNDGRSHDGRSHDGRSHDGRSHDGRSHSGRSHGGRSHGERSHDGRSHEARSLRDDSVREPSITHHSMHDGSVIHRSVQDGRSTHGGSEHRVSGRSIAELSNRSGGRSLHNRSAHDLSMQIPSDGYRSPSLPEASVRDPSLREALSDGDRENDHAHDYERSIQSGPSPSLHAPSHRGMSPSLHAPSHRGSPSLHAPSSHRAMSPSLLDPHSRVASPFSHREASPSIHALSHREGSPSIHAPSHREASIRAPSHRDHSPSIHRGASPSLQAPSFRGASPNPNGNGITYSPPESIHALSERSRAPSSIASSKVPMSSIGGRFMRPKSPLSASESSIASSRRARAPLGPEITPVVVPGAGSAAPSMHAPSTHAPSMHAPSTHAPSVASHRTGASRSVARSPLVSQFPMGEAPPPPPKAPSVAGSHRSGRASEARTTRSSASRRRL